MAIPKNDALWAACREHGVRLNGLLQHDGASVDGASLLYAISGCESTFGQRAEFVKHEPGYLPGGLYFKRSQALRTAYYTYGVLAASSFGAFQLMFIAAAEMGFAGHPVELQQHAICAKYAADLIRKRFIYGQGCKTLAQVLDAYNSGNAKDANVPTEYVAKGIAFYREITTRV